MENHTIFTFDEFILKKNTDRKVPCSKLNNVSPLVYILKVFENFQHPNVLVSDTGGIDIIWNHFPEELERSIALAIKPSATEFVLYLPKIQIFYDIETVCKEIHKYLINWDEIEREKLIFKFGLEM